MALVEKPGYARALFGRGRGCRRRGFGRGHGLAVVTIALVWLATAGSALAAQADIAVDVSVTESAGAERTVSITATNRGPDEWYAGDQQGDEPTRSYLQFNVTGADVLSSDPSCEAAPVSPGGQRCKPTNSLDVGESVGLELRLRITDQRRFGSSVAGGWGSGLRTV
jgi:hypothetical protein